MEINNIVKSVVKKIDRYERIKAYYKALQIHIYSNMVPPSKETWIGPIFIHVPKAAGSSILKMPVKRIYGHKPFRYYERRLPQGKKMPLTFAVVRNPYTRLASSFYYLKNYTKRPYDRRWANKNIANYRDLNDFVIDALHKKKIMGWMHFKPQTYFLCSQDENIGVDYILRFEELDSEWPKFAKIAGLPINLPKTNVTGKGIKYSELTEKSKTKIYSLYKQDFKLLGYHK